jgi:hypothetical protein
MDIADQSAGHESRGLVPEIRCCLPLRRRAVVFERDGIDAIAQVVKRRLVGVSQSDAEGPIIRVVGGYMVEERVICENARFLLLFVDRHEIVHYVLIQSGTLARIDLEKNHPCNCCWSYFDTAGSLLRGYLSPWQNEHECKQEQVYGGNHDPIFFHWLFLF